MRELLHLIILDFRVSQPAQKSLPEIFDDVLFELPVLEDGLDNLLNNPLVLLESLRTKSFFVVPELNRKLQRPLNELPEGFKHSIDIFIGLSNLKRSPESHVFVLVLAQPERGGQTGGVLGLNERVDEVEVESLLHSPRLEIILLCGLLDAPQTFLRLLRLQKYLLLLGAICGVRILDGFQEFLKDI